jgi:hypothetical protein
LLLSKIKYLSSTNCKALINGLEKQKLELMLQKRIKSHKMIRMNTSIKKKKNGSQFPE